MDVIMIGAIRYLVARKQDIPRLRVVVSDSVSSPEERKMVKQHARGGNPAEVKRDMHLVVLVVQVRFLLTTDS
jgi:hypothetical protein